MNRYFLTHRKFAVALLIGAVALARVGGITPRRGAQITSDLDSPYDLDVVAAAGVCPRGLAVGDRIAVDQDGSPSVALCRVAVTAIGRAGMGGAGVSESRASCVCPLEEQRVTFAVAAAAHQEAFDRLTPRVFVFEGPPVIPRQRGQAPLHTLQGLALPGVGGALDGV